MPAGRARLVLLGLVAAGTLGRVVVAFATYGVQYDIDSARIVAEALRTPGQGPYPSGRWPYPPGFFPLDWLADATARVSGLPFHGLVQVPAIAADAALAFLVTWFLLRGGRSERAALAGAALVALGPSFAVISGYHGQIDSVAILPAALGAVVWCLGGDRRALAAGVLIGVGAAVKTVPLFTVFALLPTVRDRREAAVLVATAVAVPVGALAPWLVMDPGGTAHALTQNHGVPGFAGLSAFLEPALTRYWSAFDAAPPPIAPAIQTVTDAQNLIVGAAVLAVAAVCRLRRTPALDALVLVWLTVLAVNPNFAYQYVVWTLPFLLLAGRLRAAAGLQLALLVPTLLLYTHADKGGWTYWAFAQAAWVTIALLWLRQLWRVSRSAPSTEASQAAIAQGT